MDDDDERRERAGAFLLSARGDRSRRSLARALNLSEATLRQYEHGWREVHVDGVKHMAPAHIPPARVPAIASAYGVKESELRDLLGLPPMRVPVRMGEADVTVMDKASGEGTGMNRVIVRREGLEVETVYGDAADRAQVLLDIFAAIERSDDRERGTE
jgi:DNA-binding transcriptional regulator YdaS (Cro superfamily)